ncbi:uncharacterized protein SPAPADRAFT_60226 [Spathaspora passalidarum NRRL Y-27907]|uniref:Uncharacterized protein n=1 Tax=Spathaspora passalidarum (strain NRRL Y-27907 / 11-Y1) TaxID=619300 RepID=G3AK73_SPAPN|nr:uncharacterized protein SPAPADRAFT_60226 [Spathaspora passalidarum NRRL Y-27907]EGW32884.1 hypothetical protein SPAPADRAFT_60226 [Spathaspora passalidarum NRRL Y-27907]
MPTYFSPSSVIKFTTAPTQNKNALLEKSGLKLPFLDLGNGMNSPQNTSHQFELSSIVASRFMLACIAANNVVRFTISLPGLKSQVMNNGSIFLMARMMIQYIYSDGSISNINGNIRVLMGRDLAIEWVDCQCLNYQSSLALSGLERKWANFLDSKAKDPKKGDKDFLNDIYENTEAVKLFASSGIHQDAMRIMQVGDVMSNLKSLMEFDQVNNISSPMKSLELYVSRNSGQIALQSQLAQAQFQAQVQAQVHAKAQAQAQAQAQAHAAQAAQAAQAQFQAQAYQVQMAAQQASSAPVPVPQQSRNSTISSPSPRTIHAEDPKKKRKASTTIADNKRRK